MTIRLKNYICSRVLETLKGRNNEHASIPYVLSNYLAVGRTKNNTNIEFCLPVLSLQKFLGMSYNDKINLSDVKKLGSNGVICDVKETVFKNNLNIVFQINKHMFVKEVLHEITGDSILWRKTIAQNILPQSLGKNVIVEFSSPNIAKPFHMGHLRSTIIGNFISNLLEFLSCNVIRLNYLGDWGTQFGLLQVGLDICGYTEAMIKQSPMQLLYHAYVEANRRAESDSEIGARARDIFQSLEKGDKEIIEKWTLFRKYTVEELQNVYNRLGVCFDDYHWESSYSAKEIASVLENLQTCGILKVDNAGRQVVDIDKNVQVPVVKSDGSTLYLTRDIAAAIDRHMRYNFSEMLYVVDNGQTYHFTSLFGTLSKMQFPWATSLKHVKFGRVRGMSTRKGSVVFLNDILDESRDIMTVKQKESPSICLTFTATKIDLSKTDDRTNDILGISAVIINDLKQRRQKDYEFDWNRALQVQGDTGVKLQYTHCRLCSLEKNCGVTLPTEFSEIIFKSYEELEACILVNYLLRFWIKNEDKHIGAQRLLLFHASRLVLNEGMRIVGLKPLHEM
ncbi:putative arginine--tRNA ligase [Blattella germanica]|nr:putative arginine--tRNA ligase [Blattella germanica]